MNENKIFEMTSHLDDKYILEAAGKQSIRQTKHHKRISAKFVAIAAAAAVMTVTAGAAAVAKLTNKKSVEQYYDSSAAEKIEQEGYAVGKVSKNPHFEAVLESVMRDEYRCIPIITLKPLDDTAVKCMSELRYGPVIEYKDGSSVSGMADGEPVNNTGMINPGSRGACFYDPQKDGDSQAVKVFVYYKNGKAVIEPNKQLVLSFKALSDDYKGLFDGIRFELPTPEMVSGKMLYSPSGNELYISKIGMAELSKVPESPELLKYKVHFANGTVKTYSELGMQGSNLQLDGKDKGWAINFGTLIDADQVESVEIYGETYKSK